MHSIIRNPLVIVLTAFFMLGVAENILMAIGL